MRLLTFGLVSLAQGASLAPRDHTDSSISRPYAEANAAGIVNMLLGGMRQWGSSVHHNGMAFIPARVPEGTLLYHGGVSAEVPDGLEWLAFEIEHAQNFARSFKGDWKPRFPPPGTKPGEKPPAGPGVPPKKPHNGPGGGGPPRGPPPGKGDSPDDDATVGHRGYLHTYRTTRPLKLLYIDGMAAAKAPFGPLDQQDLILATKPISPGYNGEFERATQLCTLLHPAGVDGIVRMEAGFEIIYCDFASGVEQLGAMRQPYPDSEPWFGAVSTFQWLRAVARRYDGIGAQRVQLAWSTAVAGWWYPFNISSLDPARPSMPRFEQASPEMRAAIRTDVIRALGESWPSCGGVDWQGVADMLAARFSRRLQAWAAPEVDPQLFVTQVMATAAPYFDTPLGKDGSLAEGSRVQQETTDREKDAVVRCSESFFYPVAGLESRFTPSDTMIHAALINVTYEICNAIFSTRAALLTAAAPKTTDHGAEAAPPGRPEPETPLNHVLIPAVPKAQPIIQALVAKLDWAEWRRCSGCKVDEECFIAMFPFGTPQDHFSPRCFNDTGMHEHAMLSRENSYWHMGMGGGGRAPESEPVPELLTEEKWGQQVMEEL
ncbi:uncharacterized protein BROUX77_004127 [Berkeleyomyces rouxiae]|uniref:uncharacterized protein n=1 Tax=Berkeleyomyces rouxiae TaxID=2035830 RepID=UPI003B7BEB2F